MENLRLLGRHDREELYADQSWQIELHHLLSPGLSRSHSRLLSPSNPSRDSESGIASEDATETNNHAYGQPSLTSRASSVANDSSLATPTAAPQSSDDHDELANLSNASAVAVKLTHSDNAMITTKHVQDPEMHLDSFATTPVYWTSVWLRKRTLIALEALFISLLVSLVVVWYTNRSQHGFRPVLSTNHYAWTYGPTAVLVVVLSLWRQVDYHCKLMQPWLELGKGPTDADNSMLLDYLSPMHVTSLARAVRHRHAAVAASIVGFVLIKIVMVASTGMLILSPVSLAETRPVALITAFDGGIIWDTGTILKKPGGYAVSSDNKDFNPYVGISESSVNAYVKSLSDRTSRSAEASRNLLDDSTFQTFETRAGPEKLARKLQSISTDVEAFVPNVSCEIAKPTLRLQRNDENHEIHHRELLAQLESTTCSVGADFQTKIVLGLKLGPGAWLVNELFSGPTYQLWRVNCSEVDVTGSLTNVFDANTPYDFRFALLVSPKTVEPVYIPNDTSHTPVDAPDAAAVICKIDYTMYRSTLSHDYANDTLSLRHLDRLPPINNLTGMMLGEMIMSAISEAEGFQGSNALNYPVPPLFHILPQALDGNTSTARPMSSEELRISASRVITGVSLHLIQQYFVRPASIEANGTVVFIEDRLILEALSFWLMLLGLGLMIILTACIAFTASHGVLPQDPALIMTDAAILSSSPALQRLLGTFHKMRTTQMANSIRNIRFSTVVDTAFTIAITREETSEEVISREIKTHKWLPLSARYPMMCLTLMLPLAAIVVLEILYRVSTHKNGFADVTGYETTAEYLSRYGSTLLVLLVATCFSSLDFTIAMFAPYTRLRWGLLPANGFVAFRIIGSLPPVALFRSAQSRHASSFLSNLAGMIGSVLAIVASGLWSVDRAVLVQHGVIASLSSVWDIEWPNSVSSGDAGAAVTFNNFQHGSASMPPSIFEAANFVLPDIRDIRYPSGGYPAPVQENTLVSRNFTFQIDVLRPLLSCEIIDDENIKVDFLTSNVDSGSWDVRAYPKLSVGCEYSGQTEPEGDSYSFGNGNKAITPDPPYGGQFLDLHLGPQTKDSLASSGFEEVPRDPESDNPAGCPSIGAYLGAFPYDASPDNITAVICSQKLQTMRANITYTGSDLMYPGLDFPPTWDELEGFSQNLTNGTKGVDSFPYRVQSYLRARIIGGNLTELTAADGATSESTQNLDVFMSQMVFRSNDYAYSEDDLPLGLKQLLGKSNQHVFVERLSEMYTRYMRLVIHKRFRKPVDLKDAATVSGTAYSLSSRIKVNQASKLVMQAMLGVMTLLGLLAFLLTDLRGTLPRKPTSIASRMALLAGSDLCAENKHMLPPDAIWKSEKELAKLFDGWLFSLGWWKKSAGNDGFGDAAAHDPANSEPETTQDSRRFGIDVGVPEQLGFRQRKRWLSS